MQLEIARVDVGREHADIALGQVRQELGWMLQDRKAEEPRDLSKKSAAAMCTALMPISISTLAYSASLAYGLRARSLCDQVWVPTVMLARCDLASGDYQATRRPAP